METDDTSDFYSILYNGHVKYRRRSISVINSNTATDILYLYNNTQPQRTVSWFVQAFRTESCTKFLCAVFSLRSTLLICKTWLGIWSQHLQGADFRYLFHKMPRPEDTSVKIKKDMFLYINLKTFKNLLQMEAWIFFY